ncbi:LURP-one-related/scramblase family protein [Halobacillus mangrovi]|uniref:Uncharacterized protein n=1 Tax=Halobacillus mangrovi TaxID=402384 RepID=A0A1W5ZWZ5_9BACI|nr:hypothetical protein [Halobacillus mangrovi]ARI77790.1 hypothetical protein HM131_13440 [Halobacillus mangrovi]
MEACVYFSDNFFSTGRTDIYNKDKDKVGSLHLKSAFSSSVDVEDINGKIVVQGSFPIFSNRWSVQHSKGEELGKVKTGFSFFKKRFRYETSEQSLEIESPAMSKDYTMTDQSGVEVATFRKVSSFFQSAAYELKNHTSSLSTEELISVVMGVNAIEKRRSSAANGSPT